MDEQVMVPQDTHGIELLPLSTPSEPAPSNIYDDLQLLIVDPISAQGTELGNASVSLVLQDSSSPLLVGFLERAWNSYTGTCTCGTRYNNNCAHFLTNAFALAGATFPAGAAKCPAGRMIRAKEVLAWWKTFSTGFQNNHNSISNGYWMVYQESGGQGHVCLHLESLTGRYFRGTGDYPNWPVQWHYFY